MVVRIVRIIPSDPIEWWVDKSKHSEGWIGSCEELGLTVQGDTVFEVMDSIRNDVEHLLLDLYKDGILKKFFKLRDIEIAFEGEEPSRMESIKLDLPMNISVDILDQECED